MDPATLCASNCGGRSLPRTLPVGTGGTSTPPKMMGAKPFGTVDFSGVMMPYLASLVALCQ
jgi:hypothetical protein